jgi:hypothetical protein
MTTRSVANTSFVPSIITIFHYLVRRKKTLRIQSLYLQLVEASLIKPQRLCSKSRLILTGFLLLYSQGDYRLIKMALFYGLAPCTVRTHHPDDGGSKDLWNAGKFIPLYMALQSRKVIFELIAVKTSNPTELLLVVVSNFLFQVRYYPSLCRHCLIWHFLIKITPLFVVEFRRFRLIR